MEGRTGKQLDGKERKRRGCMEKKIKERGVTGGSKGKVLSNKEGKEQLQRMGKARKG